MPKMKHKSRMKIGGVSYTCYGYQEGLPKMRAWGYDCLDFQGLVNTQVHELFQLKPRQFWKRLEEIRKMVSDNGLGISQVHGPWRCPPQDATPEDRAERMEKMRLVLEATSRLGSRNMVIHPIMPFGLMESKAEQRQQSWEINKEFFGQLLETAREFQVVVNLENMPFPHLGLARPEAIIKFVKEMDSPWFKFCLDTGHAFCIGGSPDEAVRLAGRVILQTLHVHDNCGNSDSHFVPYVGSIDWEAFRLALQDIGFGGTLSLENHPFFKYPDKLRLDAEMNLVKIAAYLAGRD